MKRKYPHKNEQFSRARLAYPYFKYLINSQIFKKDVENIRIKYWINQTPSTIYKISLFVLHQDFWDPDFDWMSIVNRSWTESKDIWILFHKEIEKLWRKYRIRNFPNLTKEYTLTGRFGDLLMLSRMSPSDETFQITIPRWIKKKDFENIWNKMQKHNEENPIKQPFISKYSKTVIKRSESVEKIDRKYITDQHDICLLIEQELVGGLENEIKNNITLKDNTRKSKLKKIVKDLFSLLNQLSRGK